MGIGYNGLSPLGSFNLQTKHLPTEVSGIRVKGKRKETPGFCCHCDLATA